MINNCKPQLDIRECGNDLLIAMDKSRCNLADTLDCGQCFRFAKTEQGITGIAKGRILRLSQTDEKMIFHNTTKKDFDDSWKDYFDLETDYEAIKDLLCSDSPLQNAIAAAGGIHILKQDSFEALISFLISQNNNIPRIKGSIDKLCRGFGKKLDSLDLVDSCYAFPTLSELAGVKKADLAGLSLGYRDDYILDCVQKLHDGELSLEKIAKLPIEKAREELRLIKGVGPKVAECVLLFGFYRVEAFPIDTWIKKVLAAYYPNGFPKAFAEYAGIAQQYLFHAMRLGLRL